MKTLLELKNKDRVTFGKLYPGSVLQGHHADIEKNKSIRIYGVESNHVNGPQQFDKTFRIGDIAEYDSYNFSYLGTIIGISEKCVTFQRENYKHNVRLHIRDFAYRNWDFDLKRIQKENEDTAISI